MMATNDPRQVIIDFLSAPSIPTSTPVSGNETRPRGRISRGGFGAKTETMHFLKERVIPGRQVHFVTFEDEAARTMHISCYVAQDKHGDWHFRGGAGGGSGRGPIRDHAWANLGGGGWPDDFYAGGYVMDNGLDVALVRLVYGEGQALEDSVESRIVLFVTDQKVQRPMKAELYDRSGQLVGSHILFKG
jgi:hypothetical protein